MTLKSISIYCLGVFLTITSQLSAQLNWVKHPANPVVNGWTGNATDPNGYRYALEPAVTFDSSKGRFHMWFVSRSYVSGASLCISEAISDDGAEWYAKMKNPVLAPGNSSSFDYQLHEPRMFRDSTEYRMYYSGQDINGQLSSGVAISPDMVTWTKYSGNPILQPSGPGTWDSKNVTIGDVIKTDSNYVMWYCGTNIDTNCIGMATSGDGIHWTKYADNPVLRGTPGAWDAKHVQAPTVIRANGLFHMFYVGDSISYCCKQSIGYAYSADGIHWVKPSAAPILSAATGWEDRTVGPQTVQYENGKFHMWYSALNNSTAQWQIGYATSDLSLSVQDHQHILPNRFKLYQSYPNPFNPLANIEFDVPQQSVVSITVFNTLGQEVKTVVNRSFEPGHHVVTWDAGNAPSGAYYYRMQSAEILQWGKMMLVK